MRKQNYQTVVDGLEAVIDEARIKGGLSYEDNDALIYTSWDFVENMEEALCQLKSIWMALTGKPDGFENFRQLQNCMDEKAERLKKAERLEKADIEEVFRLCEESHV